MKLRFRTKLSYGIGGVADNALYTLEATYLLFFLTQIAGIKPAVAGAIMAFGSIFESICGPIVGYTSDNIKTKYGKRKPFMIIAAIPTAVVSTLLFSYLDAGPLSKILYYTVLVLLYWGLFAIFFVPYIAWGSDLTEDYNERTSLRSFAYIGNQTGMAIGMVLPAFVTASLQDSGMSGAAAWRIIGISTGAISAFVLLFSSLTIHETDNPGCREKNDFKALFTKAKLIAMFREYINIFKLRPAKYLILSSFICLIGSTFFKSSLIYRLSYDLGLSGGISSIAFLAITIAGIVFSPLLAKLSCFTDKTFVFKTRHKRCSDVCLPFRQRRFVPARLRSLHLLRARQRVLLAAYAVDDIRCMRGRGARLGSETFRLGHIDAGAFGIDIVRRRHTTARHRARIVGLSGGTGRTARRRTFEHRRMHYDNPRPYIYSCRISHEAASY